MDLKGGGDEEVVAAMDLKEGGDGGAKERKKERKEAGGGGWKMPARVSPQVGLVGEARSDGYRWIREDPMVFCA